MPSLCSATGFWNAMINKTQSALSEVARRLAAVSPAEEEMGLATCRPLPSVETVRALMDQVRKVIFPDFFGAGQPCSETRPFRIGVDVEELFALLSDLCGADQALTFLETLPEIRRRLLTDVSAVAQNDPAVTGYDEIISCYPVVTVMLHYRTAHQLLLQGVSVIPRIITELAHSVTGVDIHPAARIGTHFAIDHGTGIVIGATSVIGDHVMLYQGVTLGARNFKYDEEGLPLDIPRHPILEDNVIVYANSTVLGRITIGHDAVIGGNIWVTEDVPPGTRILQNKYCH